MIREILPGDLPALLQLYTQLHDNLMPEPSDSLTAVWTQIMANQNHHIIVAEEAGSIVSSCTLTIIPNLTHGQRPYALIENVVTDSACRKQGLATACLNFAGSLAEAADCYKIMLLTGAKQAETLCFYEKAGYNSKDKTAFIKWLNP